MAADVHIFYYNNLPNDEYDLRVTRIDDDLIIRSIDWFIENNGGTGDPNEYGNRGKWYIPEGKRFKEWNTEPDGTGITYAVGSTASIRYSYYAIWEESSQSIEYLTTDQSLTAIADAIRAKGGTSAPLVYPTGFVSAINAIPSGGGGRATDDVVFYDYDGSVVTSYSASDFASLSAMPANPTHTGLTSQGWNWSLADAKAHVAKYEKLNIGQMYITDDGKTRVYIHLEKGRTSPMLCICPNGTVDVDWGDDSEHDTLTGTSTSTQKTTPNHDYAAPGDYVIKLTITGTASFSSNCGLLTFDTSNIGRNIVYKTAITKIEIGSGITSLQNVLSELRSLASITIPNSVTNMYRQTFNNCYSLCHLNIPQGVTVFGGLANCRSVRSISIPKSMKTLDLFDKCYSFTSITIPENTTSFGGITNCDSFRHVILPDGISSMGYGMFNECVNLISVNIPNNITVIAQKAFYNCYSLSTITIPENVSVIASKAFYYCYSIKEYHLLPTTPPRLVNTDAFAGISEDCIIYVPDASLDAYKTATNWSTYASYMQGE